MPTESWAALMARAEAPSYGTTKLLTPGNYRVKVAKVKAGVNSRNGKDTLGVMLVIESEGPFKGEVLWDNLTVSPESETSLGIFFAQFAAMGGSLQILEMGGTLDQAAQPIVGQVLDIVLINDEYPKGQNPPKINNKIRRYSPATGAAPVAPVTVPQQGISDNPPAGLPF